MDRSILEETRIVFGLSQDEMETVERLVAESPSVEPGVWHVSEESPSSRGPAVTLFERTR